MDLISFGALAASHNRMQVRRFEQRDRSLFFNSRMAYHADAKAAKKWVKQWRKPEDDERQQKKDTMRLKQFVPASRGRE